LAETLTYGYPQLLQAIRPDLTVVNAGRPGDVAANLERFRAVLATGPYQTVVLLLGTNDFPPPGDPGTPRVTAQNILRMAKLAQARGADVLVLTIPPRLCGFEAQSSSIALPGRQADHWSDLIR
jgi:lysophospholipase L1-like esterase